MSTPKTEDQPSGLDAWLDEVFAPFSQQTGTKSITLTWSTKDSITEAKAAIKAELAQQVAAARQALVDEFQTVAIPETTEYANGWNDCRKRVRADLNRLAALTPKSTEPEDLNLTQPYKSVANGTVSEVTQTDVKHEYVDDRPTKGEPHDQ